MTQSSSDRKENNLDCANQWNTREQETGLEVLLACTEGNKEEYVIIDIEEEQKDLEDDLLVLHEAALTCIGVKFGCNLSEEESKKRIDMAQPQQCHNKT